MQVRTLAAYNYHSRVKNPYRLLKRDAEGREVLGDPVDVKIGSHYCFVYSGCLHLSEEVRPTQSFREYGPAECLIYAITSVRQQLADVGLEQGVHWLIVSSKPFKVIVQNRFDDELKRFYDPDLPDDFHVSDSLLVTEAIDFEKEIAELE